MAISQSAYEMMKQRANTLFWDLNVYTDAVNRFSSGENPYSIQSDLLFVYQPIVLRFFALFKGSLGTLLFSGYLFALFQFLTTLKTKSSSLWFAFFVGSSFLGLSTLSFVTGNITFFLHLLITATLLAGIDQKSSRRTFCMTVGFASLIKPYMLAYLVIPVVFDYYRNAGIRAALRSSLYVILVYGLICLVEFRLDPDLTHGFLTALKTQTIERGDIGLSLYGFFKGLSGANHLWSLLAHVLSIAFIGLVMLAHLFKQHTKDELALILLLYFTLTLINPRLKEYDIPLAMFALFASAVLTSTNKRDWLFLVFSNLPAFIHSFVTKGFFSASGRVLYLTIGLYMMFFLFKFLSRGATDSAKSNEADHPCLQLGS